MKKIQFQFFFVFLVLVAVIFGGVYFTNEVEASSKKIQWKFMSNLIPIGAPVDKMKSIFDDIEKITNGRLVVKHYWHGEHTYKGEDLLAICRDRLAEMVTFSDAYLVGVVPDFAIGGLPYLMRTLEQRDQFHTRLPEVWDPFLRKEWNQFMTKISFNVSRESIYTKTKFNSKDGLKGMKIRVFGPPTAKLVKIFGGTPVSVEYGELYTALQRGTIDGCLTSMGGAHGSKLWEVCKYGNMWGAYMTGYWVTINLDAWNELPSDIQKILLEYFAKEGPEVRRLHDYSELLYAEEGMDKYGATLNGLPLDVVKWASERCKTEIWPETIEKMGPLGEKTLKLASEILGEKLH